MNRFLMVAALVPTIMLGGCWDMGKGEKVGQINRVAQTGVFCKTWEATIQRGGLSNGSGSLGTAFDFTIENNDELVEKLKYAMEHSIEVKISYRSEMISFCRSDSGSHFLTAVEYIAPEKTESAPVQTNTNETTEIKKISESLDKLTLSVNNLTSLLEYLSKR